MQLKINELIRNETNYEFPIFMRLARKTIGLSRKTVAEMLAVSETKVYYLEKGAFSRGPDVEFVETISKFYGIESALIMKKLNDYAKVK